MSVRKTILLVIAVFAVLPLHAWADSSVSFPLGPHYRPGQYVPMLVHTSSEATVHVGASGVLPVQVTGRAVLVPLLVLETPGPLTANEQPIAITFVPLTVGDRIVGITVDSPIDVEAIAGRGIQVRLDPQVLRDAPPLAFELLDALVLERIEPDRVAAWLAAGVTLIITNAQRPDEIWPWRLEQGAWVLRASSIGPDNAVAGEAAYAPVLAWRPGVSLPIRRQILLAGVVVLIVILAACLLHGWAAVVALMLVTIVASAAIAWWSGTQSKLRLISGQIAVDHGSHIQWDQWTYLTSRTGTHATMPISAATRPILVSPEHAASMRLQMLWSSDPSARAFAFEVKSGAKLALLSRHVTREFPWTPVTMTSGNLMHPLVRSSYLSGNWMIGGEVPLHDGGLILITPAR